MLGRRLQVLIDEARYRRLVATSRERKISVGALVREAIDAVAPQGADRKRLAAKRILSAPRMAVLEPEELKKELERIRGGAHD